MDNKQYTELYNALLNGINEDHPDNAQELVSSLVDKSTFDELLAEFGKAQLTQAINETLTNLIEDGMIRAVITPTKIIPLFSFRGVTSQGHKYLSVVNSPKAWLKIKNALRDEGIPLTPQSASRLMAKILF